MKIDYLKLLHETEEKANLNEAGKKWPEDYVKTAKNNILNSPLGKTFWYAEEYIDKDLKNISIEFEPLAKKNTNLGYFALIIKWFLEYSGSDPRKYQDFLERKLDGILRALLWLTNNPPEYNKVKDVLKSWSFKEWEPLQKSIEEKIETEQEEKLKNLKVENKGFEIIPIASFDDFHEKFGDDKTGLQGKYTWCHANEPRTYDNWVKKDDDTGKNKYIFFVIAKKGWENIQPPDPPPDQKTGDAYDEYGTSLIAILVDTETRKLRNATLRWNHAVHPANTRMGVSDDMAFLGWGDLSEETGINIKTEINKILDKAEEEHLAESSLLTEGKHWPEDYVKTAFNTIKNSNLGKQSWYKEEYLLRDLIGPPIEQNTTKQEQSHNIDNIDKKDLAHNPNKYGMLGKFVPLTHKNSNLGYFATIIKWFIEYSTNEDKKNEFINSKLNDTIKTLLWLSNNPAEESKLKEQIKTKWTFDDFEKYQKSIEDQIDAEQSEKLKNTKLQDKGYEIVPINSYKELHEKFGGDKTGYKGESKWCHTNGKSTYDSWTNGRKYNFFVLVKKGWEKIEPPDPNTTNAYDEYGTSLIAILVDVASGKLLNATLRWNHVIEPSLEREGTSVDKAFLGWGDLAEVTGKDVEKEIKEKLKDTQDAIQKEIDNANRQVNKYLENHKDKIKELNPDTNFKIIKKFRNIVTEIKIPEGVESIGYYAFASCSRLTLITIPRSITSIGDNAFRNCSGLTSITIPDSVTSIGSYTFCDCTGLTSITIPNSVTSIGGSAFYGCSRLASITIPDSVTSIDWGAFDDCSSLMSITIPNSVTSIGYSMFHGCSRLTSITIPDSVTSIGNSAFSNCSGLTSITIPDSVTSIGDAAFFRCSGLTSITIPDSVTSIENHAFFYCSGLTSVTIPESVTSIGSYAFNGCPELKTVYCSKKIWNKFRDKFPKDAERKDPKINESYLKDVDYYDLYKKIQEDAMFSGIDGSSIGAGDIVGVDLPDEFDAEVHTNGATSPSKSILPKIQKYVSGKGGFFGPDDFTLAKNIFNKVQKRYKEQMKAMRKFAVGKQCLTCEDIFFGLGLSEEQAKELCKKHFEHAVSENNANAKLVDLAFYGSRTKGTEREDSDLDVVVQYSGPEREDTMFEILNSEDGEFGRFSIGGFIVDFNPIKGPIDEFLAKAARY